MTEIETLALAIGHLRNAVWQLIGNGEPDGLRLALQCLDLEAVLNTDNLDPSVVPLEDTPGASLVTARSLLDQIPEKVAPVAWPILDSLIVEVG
jgi:hypothetical protein